MIAAEPSRTAERVARHRAAHQLLDRPPVLRDGLAVAMLGPTTAAAMRADPRAFETSRIASFLRASMAARARFAEDQLADLRARGLGQYVVLGAGLDTFAYRQVAPRPPLRVWEVDHPATQAWKRQRLAEAGVAVPPHLTFVPVDFERQSLPAALADAGFDAGVGALFAWLGVVPYLTVEAIRTTLGVIAGATRAGGGVVFDYLVEPQALSPLRRAVRERIAAVVAADGEPWRSEFAPAALGDELRTLGFAVAEDVPPETLNARYVTGRADGLRVGGLGHLMWAGAAPYAR
jgi:methyltransferase (TIGR00027 family)